jgi:hypothetical protein
MNEVKSLTEKRKSLFLYVVVAAFIIVAIIGYSFEKKNEPIRVAFDTKGGGVVFNHKLHVALDNMKCEECHHNYEKDSDDPFAKQMNCRECHYYNKEYAEICEDANIHKRCIGKNCIDCHVQGSVNCEFCHNAESFKKTAAPKKVEFAADSGAVVFNHFAHADPDEYGLDCTECHHGYTKENKKIFPMNCRRCHYNTKYVKICEDADTHARCIGKNCMNCHEDGADDCTICHKEE